MSVKYSISFSFLLNPEGITILPLTFLHVAFYPFRWDCISFPSCCADRFSWRKSESYQEDDYIFYSAKWPARPMLLTSQLCYKSYLIASSVYQPHAYKHPRPHRSLYHNPWPEKHHNASSVRYPGHTCATLPILVSFALRAVYIVFANRSAVSVSDHPTASFHVFEPTSLWRWCLRRKGLCRHLRWFIMKN